MKKLNEILSEIGISKVKLAKYLNVSRQMVYNYLEMDDVNLWPLEKKMKLFKKKKDYRPTIKLGDNLQYLTTFLLIYQFFLWATLPTTLAHLPPPW